MKRQLAAIVLAGMLGVSGISAVPVLAANQEGMQNTDALVGIHADADAQKTGSGFTYTLNSESRRIRITGLSGARTSVTVPQKIGSAVVDFVGFWNSPDKDSVRSITLPDTVTKVGTTTSSDPAYGFANMANLEQVNLTNAVTELGNFTFYQDARLDSVTIPEYLTKIGNYVFTGCASLKSISVPTGVTSIGEGAFRNMDSLTTVYLPKSLRSVGKNAFTDDPSVTDIYYEGTEEEWNRISWGTDAKKSLEDKNIHFGYQYAAKKAKPNPTEVLFRLYNPNTGEHFYTANAGEKAALVKVGWHDEGNAWTAPLNSDQNVYRLYNPNAGDHHYTTSQNERNALVKAGWKYEGVSWLSSESRRTPVFRQYNPNAKSGAHNYTTSTTEANYLISIGWRNEGTGWYGE